jgi:hypothetical protein
MEINLEQLKKNFLTIKDIRNKVIHIFSILENHISNLKKMYQEFVDNNRQNLFVFGLDSFQFQSKLIDIEYDDMKRLFMIINNKMYCEYYKLYKIIADYVKENINDKKTQELLKINNNFPIYKDLEPYKQYNFEMIQEIHENIILLLYEINEFIQGKDNELSNHKKKLEIGLNINNFVTTFNYNIIIVKEKGILFISYIEFFHNLHTKLLQRITVKLNLLYNQVINDIRFDDDITLLDTKKQESIILNSNEENIITEKIPDLSINELTNENLYNSDSKITIIPSKEKNSNLFKKNVKKVIKNLGFIKKKEDNELELGLSKSKSTEEIFSDITNQCELLTEGFEKNVVFNLNDYIDIGSVIDNNDPYNMDNK